MSISVELDDEQSKRLEERACELGVDARELANTTSVRRVTITQLVEMLHRLMAW